MNDVWSLVAAERRALVEDLRGLSTRQWEQASLCPGWTVHDVAAHLVDNALTTPLRLASAMARARFDFDRQNQRGMERARGATPEETLAGLEAVVDRTTGPPAPVDSRLVEEVLHGEDIRCPLGIRHAYAAPAVERSLRHQVRTSVGLGGGKQRVERIRLRATDADVVLGEGLEVRGPALSLLMVVSGRDVALSELAGPGLASLG